MTEQPTKFDAWPAVVRSYWTLAQTLRPLAVFIVIWTAGGVALVLLAPFVVSLAAGDLSGGEPVAAEFPFEAATEGVVFLAAMICLSISWHRFIILKEAPGRLLPPSTEIAWRYTWRSLALMVPDLIAASIIIATDFAWTSGESVSAESDMMINVASALLTAATARIQLALSACAVGDRMGFIASWRLTRGSTWPLFWGMLICQLPIQLLDLPVSAFTAELDETSLGYRLWTYVGFVGASATGVVIVSFLSFAYLHFTHKDGVNRAVVATFE